jgi:hypothetical protein
MSILRDSAALQLAENVGASYCIHSFKYNFQQLKARFAGPKPGAAIVAACENFATLSEKMSEKHGSGRIWLVSPGELRGAQGLRVATQRQHLVAANARKNNSQAIICAAQQFASTGVHTGCN